LEDRQPQDFASGNDGPKHPSKGFHFKKYLGDEVIISHTPASISFKGFSGKNVFMLDRNQPYFAVMIFPD